MTGPSESERGSVGTWLTDLPAARALAQPRPRRRRGGCRRLGAQHAKAEANEDINKERSGAAAAAAACAAVAATQANAKAKDAQERLKAWK